VVRTISGLKTVDKERAPSSTPSTSSKGLGAVAGKRPALADHHRDSERRYPAYHAPFSVNGGPTSTIPWPSDFGKDLGGPAGWDNTGFTFDPGVLKNYFATNTKETTDQYERRIFSELHMRERQTSPPT
jgi:iron complex outermembrane receptor protein